MRSLLGFEKDFSECFFFSYWFIVMPGSLHLATVFWLENIYHPGINLVYPKLAHISATVNRGLVYNYNLQPHSVRGNHILIDSFASCALVLSRYINGLNTVPFYIDCQRNRVRILRKVTKLSMVSYLYQLFRFL